MLPFPPHFTQHQNNIKVSFLPNSIQGHQAFQWKAADQLPIETRKQYSKKNQKTAYRPSTSFRLNKIYWHRAHFINIEPFVKAKAGENSILKLYYVPSIVIRLRILH